MRHRYRHVPECERLALRTLMPGTTLNLERYMRQGDQVHLPGVELVC